MEFGGSNLHVLLTMIVIFLLLLWGGLKVKGSDFFSPWAITYIVWIFILILFIFYGNSLFYLNGPFLISLFLWVLSFCFSSIFSYCIYPKKKYIEVSSINIDGSKWLFVISILLSPVYLFMAYKTLSGDYGDLFFKLRLNANQGNNEWGALVYLRTLNQVLLVASLWMIPNISKYKLLYVYVVNFLFGLAIMEKGVFFFITIVTLYVLYEKKYIQKKTIAISLSIFIFVAYLFNEIRESATTDNTGFFDFFILYILSPSVAFEQLKPDNSIQFGACTFSFIYAFINSVFNENYEVVLKLKDFVLVPIPTNVFTIMQPYYEDFGYIGVFVFGLLNGLIMGLIYKRCKSGNLVMKCLYGYVMEILLLQFFQENFFVSLSVVIQFIFFSYLFFLEFHLKIKK